MLFAGEPTRFLECVRQHLLGRVRILRPVEQASGEAVAGALADARIHILSIDPNRRTTDETM